MNGIKIFSTLEEAQAAGFAPFERTPDGYLVRKDDRKSYALAIVKFRRPQPVGCCTERT